MQVVGAIGGVFVLLGFLVAVIQVTWPWSAIPLVVILVLTALIFAGRRKYRQMLWFQAEAEWLRDGCDEGNRLWLESILKEADELHRRTEAAARAERAAERDRDNRERAGCTGKVTCRCSVHLDDMIAKLRDELSDREFKLRKLERQPAVSRDFFGARVTPFDPDRLVAARQWVEELRNDLTDLKNEQRARRTEERILLDNRLKAKMTSLEEKMAMKARTSKVGAVGKARFPEGAVPVPDDDAR